VTIDIMNINYIHDVYEGDT